MIFVVSIKRPENISEKEIEEQLQLHLKLMCGYFYPTTPLNEATKTMGLCLTKIKE